MWRCEVTSHRQCTENMNQVMIAAAPMSMAKA
jgi:hypothetical protein